MRDPKTTTNLVDELAEEFARRLRSGEQPSVDEFAARHPELADEIRSVLTAVAIMEQLKPHRDEIHSAAARQPSPSGPAVRVGEFRIVREVGRGGMGIVYEAYQETLGRRVAIKLLAGHLLTDEKLRVRFQRESRAAARLHHTNIVPVFVVGESDGQCYYVMQFIDGRGLDQIIRRITARHGEASPQACSDPTYVSGSPESPPLGSNLSRPNGVQILPSHPDASRKSPHPGEASSNGSIARPQTVADLVPFSRKYARSAARIGVQVADALAYSHSRGVLHRDIKPSNLLLDEQGAVWVTDFGVAKLLEEANLTQSGEFAGTLKYMPPERFSGRSDARGDVYSLGVTLYELLTLHSAFPETTPQHLIQLISEGSPEAPRRIDPGVPVDLETIILKAIARDPGQRYQSAGEFAEDLRRFLDDRPILAKRSSVAERAWLWCRRNPAVASATALVFAMLMLVTLISLVAYARTSAASREVAAANRDMENALSAEKAQRQHAESVSDLALEALNRTYERFAPTRLVATPPVANEEGIELPSQPALPPEAVPLLEDLLRTYEKMARAGGEFPGLQARAAEANHRIGDICQRLGRSTDAVTAYRMAIDLYSRPREGPDDDSRRIKLARACNELGRTLRSLQQVDEARQMHQLAIKTLTDAPETLTERPECRFELARTYYALGEGERFLSTPGPGGPPPRGDPGRGPPGRGRERPPFPGPPPGPPPDMIDDQFGRRAVAVLEQLVVEYPTVPEYRHLLACCYRDMPPVRGGPGSQTMSSRASRSVELLRHLVAEFPKVPDYVLDLCETLDRPGPPPGRAGNPDSGARSEERIGEAVKLSEELVSKYANVPAYSAALARYLNHLAMAFYRAGKLVDAEACYLRSLKIQGKLVRQYPDVVAYGCWLSMMEHGLARVQAERGEWKEARARLESASTRIETLKKKEPHLEWAGHLSGMIYRDLARVLDSSGESVLATEARQKADELGGGGGPGPFGPRNR
jgi:serine/threonine protein kinase